jgi:hypothetical protein
VTESHGESVVAVNASVPPPEFVTLTEAGAGFVALPWDVPNLTAICETMSVGAMLPPPPPPPPHPTEGMQAAANKIQPMRFIAIPSSRSSSAA